MSKNRGLSLCSLESYYGLDYDIIDAMEMFGVNDREIEEARELRRRELELEEE